MNYVKHMNLFGVDYKDIPCITGSGAPMATTEGAVGSLYMDPTPGKLYKCTAVRGRDKRKGKNKIRRIFYLKSL